MELIPGSETSTHLTQTLGKYPEDNTLPDDGLCEPKHVGAAFMILIVLII
jgi:hypothetical protein